MSCGGRRPHQSLAAVGVAALVRLVTSAGAAMSDEVRVIVTKLCATLPCGGQQPPWKSSHHSQQLSPALPLCHHHSAVICTFHGEIPTY